MYSIDTSFFMDWQARFYPLDVFVTMNIQIEKLIDSGDFVAVELVKEAVSHQSRVDSPRRL